MQQSFDSIDVQEEDGLASLASQPVGRVVPRSRRLQGPRNRSERPGGAKQQILGSVSGIRGTPEAKS